MIERQFSMNVGGTVLLSPCFFPSISNVKTNLSPLEYLRILVAVDHPLFLVSAYDIYHASPKDRVAIRRLLKRSYQSKTIILLDSGNYEAYWGKDKKWNRTNFASVLKMQRFHLGFCYDNQHPPISIKAIVSDVERSVLRDQAVSAQATIIPIVHGSQKILPAAARRIAERLHPILIAVPERALGEGILARAETIFRIRSALDQVGFYCPLHLLGTGNPLSILIYAICGADSFDGLEWCQTTVDHATGRLFHFHQWDFFSDQTPVGKLANLPYPQAVLAHNLLFYRSWLTKICDALQAKQGLDLADKFLPERTVRDMRRRLPELF